jgi:hypothetical protein
MCGEVGRPRIGLRTRADRDENEEQSPRPVARVCTAERRHLLARAGGRCQWCRTPLIGEWHADHVIPVHVGGRTELRNGQALCAACNYARSTRWCWLTLAPLRRVVSTERTLAERYLGVRTSSAGAKLARRSRSRPSFRHTARRPVGRAPQRWRASDVL